MKLSNAIMMLALAGFITACGKDNSSGGSKSGNFGSVITAPNLPQNSTQAFSNFKSWYNSREESFGGYGPGVYELAYQNSGSASSNNGCELKTWGIFQYYTCSSSSWSSMPTASATCKVAILSTTTNVKSQNTTLARIASGQMGTLIGATQTGGTNQTRGVFNLQFQNTNQNDPAFGTVTTYVIDTNYHSSFQPVMRVRGNGQVDRLVAAYSVYTSTLPSCQ